MTTDQSHMVNITMSVGVDPSHVMCGYPRPEVLALLHIWVAIVYRDFGHILCMTLLVIGGYGQSCGEVGDHTRRDSSPHVI